MLVGHVGPGGSHRAPGALKNSNCWPYSCFLLPTPCCIRLLPVVMLFPVHPCWSCWILEAYQQTHRVGCDVLLPCLPCNEALWLAYTACCCVCPAVSFELTCVPLPYLPSALAAINVCLLPTMHVQGDDWTWPTDLANLYFTYQQTVTLVGQWNDALQRFSVLDFSRVDPVSFCAACRVCGVRCCLAVVLRSDVFPWPVL